jgi:Transposase DDE domain group 1
MTPQRIRNDTLFKIACGRSADGIELASQPSLSRFENYAGRDGLGAAKEVLLNRFIRKNERQLRRGGRLVLDIDTTDDPTHGPTGVYIL